MLKRWRKQSEKKERLQKKKEKVDSSVENGAPEFDDANFFFRNRNIFCRFSIV